MKPVSLSENVHPIGEFKAQASSVHERDRFVAAAQEGLADVEAGRLLDSDEVRRQLDAEFGPLE
jgi:predicted transcriptional regulator